MRNPTIGRALAGVPAQRHPGCEGDHRRRRGFPRKRAIQQRDSSPSSLRPQILKHRLGLQSHFLECDAR